MSTINPVFLITPTTQRYEWGKIGNSSKVAQLAISAVPGFVLDGSTPYAELWMGTHVKSPSGVTDSNKTLRTVLAEHPELLGDVPSVFDTTDGNLPFLFKVLSIGKALSIQTHPDKKTAEKLHAEQPKVYTDPNHKPELALALTPFRGLCGFMPIPDIKTYLTDVPEFKSLIPENVVCQFEGASENEEKAALKELFSCIMTADVENVKKQLSSLVERYQRGGETRAEQGIKDLVLTLNSQFPGDVGIFCSFVLNCVDMQPGEAIFLGAGEPHAYVAGDIIECMANSDNVIRAGLTPKPKDIPNLVSGLTYKTTKVDEHIIKPEPFLLCKYTTIYDPPIPDFTVLEVDIPQNDVSAHDGLNGPSIAIVTAGSGSIGWMDGDDPVQLLAGSVIFIGANTEVSFRSKDQGMTVYRAFVAVSL
ncbi:RmlC-like cupin domain-containing protein [Scleroderma yunnanense]